MRSAKRFVAVLGLVCLLAASASAQEGGFQPPLNGDPVIPIPTGQEGQPGFFTSIPGFVFGRRPVFEMPPRPITLPKPARPPKPGEHLGDYLIADKLPTRYDVPPEPPRRASTPESRTIAAILPTFGQPGAISVSSPVPRKREPDGRTSINFTGPSGMKVTWQTADGSFSIEANALNAPKEYNFAQGKTYRLRLRQVTKDNSDEAFYPTIEVAPATPKTRTFLAHSSVPVTFTADEFAHAKEGQLVVKVLYLPDPVSQDFSTVVGAEEVVSTRLEPGTDPVKEAERRGTILAVMRLGNIDPEDRCRPRSEQR